MSNKKGNFGPLIRIAVFDVECWDLSPEFAPLVCASVLDTSTGEMKTFRMDSYKRRGLAEDYTDDRRLLCDLRDHLHTFHMTAGWNSKKFDVPLIRTRLAWYEEELLKGMPHLDAMWAFKGWHGLKPLSCSLKNVSRFFGFEEKPQLENIEWLKGRVGNKAAIDEIVERCEADVRITAAVTGKALELDLIKNIGRYPY